MSDEPREQDKSEDLDQVVISPNGCAVTYRQYLARRKAGLPGYDEDPR